MENLPGDWLAVMALVLALGARHGLDADHLATIDGLTRFNARAKPRLARFCGVLFSLGHGGVVVAVALLVSAFSSRWQTPQWLNAFGAWTSILILLALGLINMQAVMRAAPGEIVQPLGLKGRWLGRLSRAAHPGLIALVGALFALSFDTLSQAALFALTATRFGGWQEALTLGFLFMLGMLATDGINGLWISHLIRRADQRALFASRVMGLGVGGVSLLIAALGVLKMTSPRMQIWSEGQELFLGAAVICVLAASYGLALHLTRPPPQPASTPLHP